MDAVALSEAARFAAAAHYAQGRRWTYWVLLTWASEVTESRATADLATWARHLRRRIRNASVVVGIHSDTDRLHGHALVFIPRGAAPPNPTPERWLPAIAQAWHQEQWPHGRLSLQRYDHRKAIAADGKHGTALYLAKDPGSVTAFGVAPVYRARRRRR